MSIFGQSATERKVRTFSLAPGFLDTYKGKQPAWGPVGWITYARTYARKTCDCAESCNHPVEEFWQTLQRVTEGTFNIQKIHCRNLNLPWDEARAQRSAQDMFQRMWDFKFLPPGRGLWMMGTDLVYEKGSACLNNCGFASTEEIDKDFAYPFTFLADMSMLGVGIGGDVRGKGKVKLSTPRISEEVYTVEDSREGWVDLIRVILNSFAGKGSYPRVVDYSKVRVRGTPIKSFGGTASGAAPLVALIQDLTKLFLPAGVTFTIQTEFSDTTLKYENSTIHLEGSGSTYRITSTQIVDAFNYIGKAVVAGGVRRSAEIMFGDANDDDFLTLKQDKEALYDRRWVSNNSIFAKIGMDYSKIAEALAVNGEPGLLWLDSLRAYSRMGYPADWKDMQAMGANPCIEQGLFNFELCCLVETYPAHHTSLEDFKKTLKMAYLYAKTVTLVPTHNPRTNAVLGRNRRIGCSMSGIVQAINKMGRREFLNWSDEGYKHIQDLDKLYSDWLCIPRSIKTTSLKPSGTISLLCGATPGIHFPHAEYYIRNIRVQNTSPLLIPLAAAGYSIEPDAYSLDTSVVSFPIHEPYYVKGKDDITIWDQFSNVADLQHHWADNLVSATITFKKEEAKDIKTCLEVFETKLKAISLLPLADSDHAYVQAPYIKITKEEYDAMSAKISPIDPSKLQETSAHDVTDAFCDGDKCMLPSRG